MTVNLFIEILQDFYFTEGNNLSMYFSLIAFRVLYIVRFIS